MKVEKKAKVIVMVPYPAQGHVTPMMRLASSLPALGFRPVMVLPTFLHRQITTEKGKPGGCISTEEVEIVSIEDGMEEAGKAGFFEIEEAMENAMPRHLERMVRGLQDAGEGIACVVIDLLASWAVQVCTTCGVTAAGFWPAMLATYRLIASIPDLLQAGLIDSTGMFGWDFFFDVIGRFMFSL